MIGQKDNLTWGSLKQGDLLLIEDDPCYMLILSRIKFKNGLKVCAFVFSSKHQYIDTCVISEKELSIPFKHWKFLSGLIHN